MKPLGTLFNLLFKKVFLASFRIRKGITVQGRTRIPKKGRGILVSLHRYDFDPLLISSIIPRHIYWVYGSFLDQVPLFRFLLKRYGFLSAAYEGVTGIHSIRQMVRILKEDELIGIFPEGVDPLINRDYAKENLQLSPSFARMAIKTRSPVIPVIIVPRRFKTTAYPVPRTVRRLFRMPGEIVAIDRRMRYQKVHIVIGSPIPPPEIPPEKAKGNFLRQKAEEYSREIQGILTAMDREYNETNHTKEWRG